MNSCWCGTTALTWCNPSSSLVLATSLQSSAPCPHMSPLLRIKNGGLAVGQAKRETSNTPSRTVIHTPTKNYDIAKFSVRLLNLQPCKIQLATEARNWRESILTMPSALFLMCSSDVDLVGNSRQRKAFHRHDRQGSIELMYQGRVSSCCFIWRSWWARSELPLTTTKLTWQQSRRAVWLAEERFEAYLRAHVKRFAGGFLTEEDFKNFFLEHFSSE